MNINWNTLNDHPSTYDAGLWESIYSLQFILVAFWSAALNIFKNSFRVLEISSTCLLSVVPWYQTVSSHRVACHVQNDYIFSNLVLQSCHLPRIWKSTSLSRKICHQIAQKLLWRVKDRFGMLRIYIALWLLNFFIFLLLARVEYMNHIYHKRTHRSKIFTI